MCNAYEQTNKMFSEIFEKKKNTHILIKDKNYEINKQDNNNY